MDTICLGDTLWGYADSGIYVDSIAARGSSSFYCYEREINLSVDDSNFSRMDTVICEGESVFGFDTSGTYEIDIPLDEECDSLIVLNLEFFLLMIRVVYLV